jgi:tetratricopeptide (TPR) repeat protein
MNSISPKQETLQATPPSDTTQPSSPVGSGDFKTVLGVCAFLVVAIWTVFGQTSGFGFVNYDDAVYITNNPVILGGLSLKGIVWAFTHNVNVNWTPLTVISHMLDCQFYGTKAGGHHLTNILLHLASTITLFLVLKEMTGALWRSAFVAAVFAVHPLHVESVAWIAERRDVLSGLFFILTLGAYVRYVRHPRFLDSYLMVIFLFALGLMCKPMLVTTPFVMLLLDYWPLKRFPQPGDGSISRRLIVEKLPLLALSVMVCVVTLFAQKQAMASLPLSVRVGNALVSYVAYLKQMIYPVKLAVYYPHPEGQLATWEIITSAILLLGISVGAVIIHRRHPWVLIGWLWYLGMLIPVIGLIQSGMQARADRYTYLPQIGLYILLTWLAVELTASWRSRRWLLGGSALAALVALIVCARTQTSYWRNDETLWTHTLACTSDNAVGQYNLGNALFRNGNVDEAITHFQTALQILPDNVEICYSLGGALLKKGKADEAITYFQKALAMNSNDADSHYIGLALAKAHNDYANTLVRMGRDDEAMKEFRKALDLFPDFADARHGLALILLNKGQVDEAIVQLQKIWVQYPDNAMASFDLGNVLLQQGQIKEAIAQFQTALTIKPDYVDALNNLAWILATGPEASLRNGNKAVELAERANQLAGGTNPVILCTLAAAYAEAGRFPEATATVQSALRLAEAQSNPALVGLLQSQLKLYQVGMPYHGQTLTQ